MNYISELNAFYDWLEINSISTSGIVLWQALMHINNKARWIREFTVATSVLQNKTGLTRRTIERARNELQQKGLIQWKSRKGNQSAVYTFVRFSDAQYDVQRGPDVMNGNDGAQSVAQCDVQHDAQHVVQCDVQDHFDITKGNDDAQSVAQCDAINKQDKTNDYIYISKEPSIEMPGGKKQYLDYVYLSDEDYQQLVSEMTEPVLKRLILELNNYIGTIGVIEAAKKYRNHDFVIRNWLIRQQKSNNDNPKVKQLRTNKFHNHEQRDYDYDLIEKRMAEQIEEVTG